jgi:hypothetical protein
VVVLDVGQFVLVAFRRDAEEIAVLDCVLVYQILNQMVGLVNQSDVFARKEVVVSNDVGEND